MLNNKTLRVFLAVLLVLSFTLTLSAQRKKRDDETTTSNGPAKARIETNDVKTDSRSME